MSSNLSRMRPKCFCVVVACALLAVSGCSDPLGGVELGQVSGKVTLDGQPLAEAVVNFTPTDGKTKGSTGTTDASGNYTLRYITGYDGAAVGTHTVEIRKVEIIPITGGEEPEYEERQVVPAAYNSKTELTAEVKPGENTFDFPLKPGPTDAGEASGQRTTDVP
jgi:hypothetical protein